VADKIKEIKPNLIITNMPIKYKRNRSDILGVVTKLRIWKTKLNVSEMYIIIYWRKNHLNSILYMGDYWESFA